MGQAAIDLPDPVEQAPAPLTSADDLLSQLAGQEIDRLLADAEEQPDAEPAPVDAAAGTEELAELEQALAATDQQAAALASDADPPSAAATDEQLAAQVGQLFKQLKVTPLEQPVAPANPAPPPPAPESAVAVATVEFPRAAAKPQPPPPPTAQPEEQTSTAERAALNPPPEPAPQEAPAPLHELVDERTPVFVRLLELLNAPLNACPDFIRDSLGKVAILTLMNAIGVLLYVVLFRKH